MYEAISQTITEDFKAEQVPIKEWKFQIPNGNTGVVEISDPLLDSEALATERADSEFLKNSYKLKEVRFNTPLTNIAKNSVRNVYGLPYIIKSISITVDDVQMVTNIRGIRYE